MLLSANLLEIAVGLVGAFGSVIRSHRWDRAASDIGVMNGFARSRHLGKVKTMNKSTKTGKHVAIW